MVNQIKRKINLQEILPVNAQSIVSRTLLENNNGSITIFTFDRGERISPHKAPFQAMLIIFDGQAELTVENEKHTLQSGESFILQRGEMHTLYALQPFKMLLFMLKN